MKIVSFSGIDGCGKSTQIKLFQKYLKNKKIKYQTIHIVQNSIANRFRKSKSQKPRKAETRCCIWGILLRKIALMIDLLIFRVSLLITTKKDTVLICDRYFIDYLINIYYLEGEPSFEIAPIIKHLMPKPALAIYLKITPEKAQKRKNEQSLDYLQKKYRLFENTRPQFDFCEIDASQNPQQVSQNIIKLFERLA